MLRTTIQGSLYVGVFARATDDVVLVADPIDDQTRTAIAEELEVSPITCTIGGATTLGALAAGNAHGMVVSGRLTDDEHDRLAAAIRGELAALPGRMNAAGNCLLVNDHGAIAHPDLGEPSLDVVSETLDVPVERLSIGGVKTVGTAAVATNYGVLCHPKVEDATLDRLEAILGVRADVGTVNYGSPLIGSGLIANANGFVAGVDTTGPELGRIEEALGFLDRPRAR